MPEMGEEEAAIRMEEDLVWWLLPPDLETKATRRSDPRTETAATTRWHGMWMATNLWWCSGVWWCSG